MNDREPYPIPVLSIVRDALIIPWHKRATMFRALLPVSVVRIASDLIWHFTPQEFSWASTFVSWIVFVLAFAVFAITTHRLILLGDGSVPRYGPAKWSSRETRFVGWILMIYLYGYIVTVIAMILGFHFMVEGNTGEAYLAIIAFSAFFVYPWARLSVLLPATAVDERPTLRWAWELTKGNGWRLSLVVGLFPVALGLSLGVFIWHFIITDLLISAAHCVLDVIGIAALSLSYKHLTVPHRVLRFG